MKKIKSVEESIKSGKGQENHYNFFRRWLNRRGLRFNLLFIVGGVSLLVILTLAFFLYLFQNRQLVQNAQTGMVLTSNTIETNLQHAMISRDVGIIKDAIKEAILEGEIHNDYDEAYAYMIKKAEEIGLKKTS